MSAAVEALVAQMQSRRTRTVELEPGKTVRYVLPSSWVAGKLARAMRAGDGDTLAQLLSPCLREWTGLTEADALGAGVGGSDPLPADPRLWVALAADRPAWVLAWAKHCLGELAALSQQQEDAAGN